MIIDKPVLTVIVGNMASGKTTLLKRFEKIGMKHIRSCTTRPMRPNEKSDTDYYFLTEDDFNNRLKNGEFLETTSFKVANGETWSYGTLVKDVCNIQEDSVILLTPSGVDAVRRFYDNCHVIFLDTRAFVCRQRAIARGDDILEVDRRLSEDTPVFNHFRSYGHYDEWRLYPAQ